MGTERRTIYNTVCQCGAGYYRVEECSPDHPWARGDQTSYQGYVECSACAKTHALVEEAGRFILVDRAELERRAAMLARWNRSRDELMADCHTAELCKAFEFRLGQLPSMSAIHRYLRSLGLEHHAVGTFRKRWRGANIWIRENVRPSNLPDVMKALGKVDEDLLRRIDETDALWKTAHASLIPVGITIYTLN